MKEGFNAPKYVWIWIPCTKVIKKIKVSLVDDPKSSRGRDGKVVDIFKIGMFLLCRVLVAWHSSSNPNYLENNILYMLFSTNKTYKVLRFYWIEIECDEGSQQR